MFSLNMAEAAFRENYSIFCTYNTFFLKLFLQAIALAFDKIIEIN